MDCFETGKLAVGRTNIGRIFAASIVALVAISATPGATSAASEAERPAEVERHCVTEVVGNVEGVLVTGPEVCYGSKGGAAIHAATASFAPSAARLAQPMGLTIVIGKHYTSTNFNGSSLTIIGVGCGGGIWIALGFWNNNIESSRHLCGGSPTRFYEYSNCTGDSLYIYGQQSSLGSLNNEVSCIAYG